MFLYNKSQFWKGVFCFGRQGDKMSPDVVDLQKKSAPPSGLYSIQPGRN